MTGNPTSREYVAVNEWYQSLTGNRDLEDTDIALSDLFVWLHSCPWCPMMYIYLLVLFTPSSSNKQLCTCHFTSSRRHRRTRIWLLYSYSYTVYKTRSINYRFNDISLPNIKKSIKFEYLLFQIFNNKFLFITPLLYEVGLSSILAAHCLIKFIEFVSKLMCACIIHIRIKMVGAMHFDLVPAHFIPFVNDEPSQLLIISARFECFEGT